MSVAEDIEVVAGVEEEDGCGGGVCDEAAVGGAEDPVDGVGVARVGGECYEYVGVQRVDCLQVGGG